VKAFWSRHYNPTLPTSQADALVEQVESAGGIGGTGTVYGNGPD